MTNKRAETILTVIEYLFRAGFYAALLFIVIQYDIKEVQHWWGHLIDCILWVGLAFKLREVYDDYVWRFLIPKEYGEKL